MSNLMQKSIKTLELTSVLSMLSSHATSAEAKSLCETLIPFTHIEDVKVALSETNCAKDMIMVSGSPSFAGIRDPRGAVMRASRGGVLSCKELLNIASLLKCTRGLINYRGDEKKYVLDPLFFSLVPNKFLEDEINTAIISEEEISDRASATLADIRRKMREKNAKIRDTLSKIISSPTQSKLLQEAIITQRGGRYVVPVKSEHKTLIPGITHDVSASGQTIFIEPMAVVNLNNELRELESKEKAEIERILAELSAHVSDYGTALEENFNILTRLDFIFAKAKLSFDMRAEAPDVNDRGETLLKRARHPLLDKKKTVPVDINLGISFDTLIITGPNTGGKTVSLKTLGLLTLMTQCGLHIPVDEGSRVAIYDKVFADIGDEQSIEQSLSTFSSHMVNIVAILEEADASSLILFDELGAGTDPVEGAALAVSIIEFARGMGAKIAASTHYTELKSYALTTEHVENASCEFDVKTLRPTYKLLIGVPGKSNAFAISKSLGLSDYIIDKASSILDSEDKRFEEIIESLEEKRTALEHDRAEAARLRREADEIYKRAEEFDAKIEHDRDKALERAKAEAERLIKDARDEAERVFEELSELRKRKARDDNYKQENEARAALMKSLNEAEGKLSGMKRKKSAVAPKPNRPIKVGDTVELINLGTKATVLTNPENGKMQVQAGIMKVWVKVNEVKLLENAENKSVQAFIQKKTTELRNVKISPEIDLRGMMAEEAVDTVERYIDSAFLAKLNTVRVIHGKGTGVLRKAVQDSLKKNRHVKSFRLGTFGEGETGVTVVELV